MRAVGRAGSRRAVLVASLLLVACGGDDATVSGPAPGTEVSSSASAPRPTTMPEPGELVLVYFLQGEQLVVGGRVVTRAEPRLLLEVLLDGPRLGEAELGFTTSIPAGTELRGVRVEGNRATVDLSAEFASGGGSLSMVTRTAQVVWTVTQLPGIEVVDFELEGEPTTELGGEGLIIDDVDRSTFESVIPLLLVEHPVPGQRVESPFTLSGTSNTSGATVEWALSTDEGVELVSGVGVATSGGGSPGRFEIPVEVPADAPEHLVLRVVGQASADGAPPDVTDVPLSFLG